MRGPLPVADDVDAKWTWPRHGKGEIPGEESNQEYRSEKHDQVPDAFGYQQCNDDGPPHDPREPQEAEREYCVGDARQEGCADLLDRPQDRKLTARCARAEPGD